MTKEEFKTTAIKYARDGALLSLSTLIREFFESNVCIPKGENRHPDADILHRVAEDITVEHEISGTDVPFGKLSIPLEIYYKALVSNDKWFNCWMVASSRFRIKPSEPIYEYLFYSPEGSTKWMTIKESETDVYFIQAKETKRERK